MSVPSMSQRCSKHSWIPQKTPNMSRQDFAFRPSNGFLRPIEMPLTVSLFSPLASAPTTPVHESGIPQHMVVSKRVNTFDLCMMKPTKQLNKQMQRLVFIIHWEQVCGTMQQPTIECTKKEPQESSRSVGPWTLPGPKHTHTQKKKSQQSPGVPRCSKFNPVSSSAAQHWWFSLSEDSLETSMPSARPMVLALPTTYAFRRARTSANSCWAGRRIVGGLRVENHHEPVVFHKFPKYFKTTCAEHCFQWNFDLCSR